MSVGFKNRSSLDSSVLMEISAGIPLMLFAGKGSNSTPVAKGNGSTFYRFTSTSPVPSSQPMPVCFLALASGVLTNLKQLTAGASYWAASVDIGSSAPVDTYWFVNPKGKAASAETRGLRVRTPEGQLLYDAGWGKLGAVKQITAIGNSDGATAAFTPLAKPAFLHLNPYLTIVRSGGMETWYHRGLNYYTSGGIKMQNYIDMSLATPYPPGAQVGGDIGSFQVPIINAADYD